VFAGEVLKYEALVEDEVYVSRAHDGSQGAVLRGRQVSALDLSRRPRAQIISRSTQWRALPDQVREWLEIQEWRSRCRAARAAGRDLSARRQILSRLLSVRGPARAPDARHAADAAARARALRPLGFVANEYALAVWGCGDVALRSSAASSRSTRCSTRTCSATISKPGSPNPR
jgi:ATP-dependent Lhr-like helicase